MAPSKPTHDHYIILEVCSTATYEEIKAAYHRLARLHHPDKNGGSQASTAKTQLLNEAWGVLRDSGRRAEYDRCYSQTKPSTSYRPSPSNSTSTPQPSSQPPRPTGTTQDDSRSREESLKKRQEWLNWERIQEQSIRQCQNQIKTSEAEINALNARINASKAKLAKHVPYWWNIFASAASRLPETEKEKIEREILNHEAAVRIKRMPLDRNLSRLKQLQAEFVQRREQENTRLAAELKEKETRERLARERAAAEARRRAAEEYVKQQAEQEARDKAAREEALRQAAAWRKKMEEEEAAREAAQKKADEEFAAWFAAQMKAAEEEEKRDAEQRARRSKQNKASANSQKPRQQQTKKPSAKGKKQKNSQPGQDNGSCNHKYWWNRVDGYHDCAHCTRPLYLFGYQCPGCVSIACVACVRILKQGGTPSVNNSNNRAGGKRQKGVYKYDLSPPPSLPPSPPRWDTYDYWD